jgi:hypothetical protein
MPAATGKVLEVAVGTGFNLGAYSTSRDPLESAGEGAARREAVWREAVYCRPHGEGT